MHSCRRVRGGRFCTRVAESVTVGHVVSKPLGSPVGLDDLRDPIHRVKTGRVCEGMPRSKRSGVRPIGRSRTFGSGHAQETCRSRIFHSDQSEKTCRSRIFHSDKSEKTCRSRIFHSDQSEKTCRSRIFPSGRGEETCRSRNFPTSRIPQQTFVLVLDRASTVTTVDSDVSDRGKHRGSLNTLKAVAFALESPSPRRSLLHSSRRIGDGRPRRLQAARFPGRIGRRPRPDSPSQNWSGVRGMPRSKRSGVRPIGRWRTFGSGHAEETCRSRIFHSDQSEKTCRSRIFHSDKSGKDLPIEESFNRTRVKRPADRGSFLGPRVKRPADRGSFLRPW